MVVLVWLACMLLPHTGWAQGDDRRPVPAVTAPTRAADQFMVDILKGERRAANPLRTPHITLSDLLDDVLDLPQLTDYLQQHTTLASPFTQDLLSRLPDDQSRLFFRALAAGMMHLLERYGFTYATAMEFRARLVYLPDLLLENQQVAEWLPQLGVSNADLMASLQDALPNLAEVAKTNHWEQFLLDSVQSGAIFVLFESSRLPKEPFPKGSKIAFLVAARKKLEPHEDEASTVVIEDRSYAPQILPTFDPEEATPIKSIPISYAVDREAILLFLPTEPVIERLAENLQAALEDYRQWLLHESTDDTSSVSVEHYIAVLLATQSPEAFEAFERLFEVEGDIDSVDFLLESVARFFRQQILTPRYFSDLLVWLIDGAERRSPHLFQGAHRRLIRTVALLSAWVDGYGNTLLPTDVYYQSRVSQQARASQFFANQVVANTDNLYSLRHWAYWAKVDPAAASQFLLATLFVEQSVYRETIFAEAILSSGDFSQAIRLRLVRDYIIVEVRKTASVYDAVAPLVPPALVVGDLHRLWTKLGLEEKLVEDLTEPERDILKDRRNRAEELVESNSAIQLIGKMAQAVYLQNRDIRTEDFTTLVQRVGIPVFESYPDQAAEFLATLAKFPISHGLPEDRLQSVKPSDVWPREGSP